MCGAEWRGYEYLEPRPTLGSVLKALCLDVH